MRTHPAFVFDDLTVEQVRQMADRLDDREFRSRGGVQWRAEDRGLAFRVVVLADEPSAWTYVNGLLGEVVLDETLLELYEEARSE